MYRYVYDFPLDIGGVKWLSNYLRCSRARTHHWNLCNFQGCTVTVEELSIFVRRSVTMGIPWSRISFKNFMRGITSRSYCDKQIDSLPAVDDAIAVCSLLAQMMGHPANDITHADTDRAVDGWFIAVITNYYNCTMLSHHDINLYITTFEPFDPNKYHLLIINL